MMDAWRGLAALGVVLYHVGPQLRFDLGHVCVMVFFVISGYCITASAESCKRNSISPIGYMWRRIHRIYPPYFFAICFFVATRALKMKEGLGDQISRSPVMWLQNLTMTQWLTLVRHPVSYAYDNHSLFIAGFWSLNYEEQFYLVMGLILFAAIYSRKSMLFGIVALMIPALIWNLIYPATSYGFFIEYWIAFALGALVFYRLCKVGTAARRACIDLTLLFFLVFSLYRSAILRVHEGRSVYAEWIVTSMFSLILVYGRRWDGAFKGSKLGWVLGGLGLISYSMYLTHQCDLRASSVVAEHLIRFGLPRGFSVLIRVAFICTLSTIFWYFCERPFLNKPLPIKSSGASSAD
jgi:peptidoglycan/LPS O-acetylase OafA/YrhL